MENYRNPAVREMAEQVRAHGRFGDSVLVHMNPHELGILAEAWPMTINPDTGQPEFFLQFLLPLVAGALGPTLGITSALGMAALTGGAGFLGGLADGQSPGQALVGGLTSGLTGGKGGTPVANTPTMFADELGMFPLQAASDAMAPAGMMATAGGVTGAPGLLGEGILGGIFDKIGSPTGLMMGLLPALVSDSFQDKGPKAAPKDKWDKMGEVEHFPDQARVPVQNYNYLGAPFGEQPAFQSGVDYAGIAPGYGAGGAVIAMRNAADRSRARRGQDENTDFIPPTPRAAPVARDPSSLFAGAAPYQATIMPTPMAMPRPAMAAPAMPQFTGTNQIANLLAARRAAGYAEGGMVDEQPQMDDKAIVGAAIAALTGKSPNPQAAIAMFVKRFGQEALKMLMAKLQGQAGGQGNGGRYMRGPGDGLSDSIPATVDGRQPSALSSGEFVIPADAVSHLGNGSNEAGAKELYQMIDRLRQARTGSKAPPPAVNQQGIMPV